MVSTPQAPDPYATANAQGAANTAAAQKTAEISMVGQSTPYGSLTYNQIGTNPDGTPRFQATTSYTPEVQKLSDTGISNAQGSADTEGMLLKNAQANIAKPLDLGWNATEANLDRLNLNTLDPQWKTSQDQLDQQLFNKGVTPGSEAYDTAMRNFNQQKDDAYNSMYLAGHNTAVNDITQQYNSPINTLTALRGNTQINQPGLGLTQTPQESVAPAPVASQINQNYQGELAASNAVMGGMFGLGGSLLGGLMRNPNMKFGLGG